MSRNGRLPDQTKKLALHLMKCFRTPVFEIPERLIETKLARASKRPKDHRQRIELPIAAEVVKGQTGQRNPSPVLAL